MILETVKEFYDFADKNNIKHFKHYEFDCPHCGKLFISEKLLLLLNELRERINKPLIITSGFRCIEYNRRIGGVPNSAHTKGLAVDIACETSTDRFYIVSFATQLGFRRIGINKRFIHLDIDESKPKPVIWLY